MKGIRNKQKSILLCILILNALFSTVPSVNWQGYGNVSSSNLTDIWSFITINFPAAANADTDAGYD